jgi:Phage integrase, N-terminal SAM-like domain
MAEISPLRRRMIEDMTVRNLSPATQQSYLNAVSKFSRYFGCSPDRLGLEDVHAFQVHLVATGISWPRSARRLPSYPPLWLPRQWRPRRQRRSLSPAARWPRHWCLRACRQSQQRRSPAHRSRLRNLSRLRGHHAADRSRAALLQPSAILL